ncbi:MAG: M16 family metallopeptidase, partial [Planctomycetota bacterium]
MRHARRDARLLATLLLLAGLHAVALAAAGLDLDAPLPVDPKVSIFTLKNGLECWVRPHATPPNRVGIWLHVGTGSINEEDDERGLAHFLEHMAFDGSDNFPPGKLVEYFESIGLTFGQHQNAFTSFDQTTYKLTLPNTQEETLSKGLLCMADFAFGLSLLPEQVDRERGVVLEEVRARKGARQRIIEELLPILLPDSRAGQRLPIGKEEVIEEVEREDFVDYYRTWYRPDNATLLIVGEVETEDVKELVAEQFAGWPAPEEAPENADPGIKPYEEVRAAVITDPEQTTADASVVTIRPLEELRTVGDFRRELVDGIGNWIVRRRLDEMVQKGTAPFQEADVSKFPLWNVCTYAEAEATGKPERSLAMLRSVLVELKRARDHGFLEQEFEDAKKALLARAEQEARTEQTWDIGRFLSAMNTAVSRERKPISAA